MTHKPGVHFSDGPISESHCKGKLNHPPEWHSKGELERTASSWDLLSSSSRLPTAAPSVRRATRFGESHGAPAWLGWFFLGCAEGAGAFVYPPPPQRKKENKGPMDLSRAQHPHNADLLSLYNPTFWRKKVPLGAQVESRVEDILCRLDGKPTPRAEFGSSFKPLEGTPFREVESFSILLLGWLPFEPPLEG